MTLHLKAIFAEGELSEEATCKDYLQVRAEGARQVSRNLRHYNLPAILAVDYCVRSPRGTQFRQWATARLSEYLANGFTMDDERLRDPPGKGHTDYFDELLERIRDIRASERRVYLRVREILALAADYSPSEPETQAFFQAVQNKLHFAVTGKTAPELIAERELTPEATIRKFRMVRLEGNERQRSGNSAFARQAEIAHAEARRTRRTETQGKHPVFPYPLCAA